VCAQRPRLSFHAGTDCAAPLVLAPAQVHARSHRLNPFRCAYLAARPVLGVLGRLGRLGRQRPLAGVALRLVAAAAALWLPRRLGRARLAAALRGRRRRARRSCRRGACRCGVRRRAGRTDPAAAWCAAASGMEPVHVNSSVCARLRSGQRCVRACAVSEHASPGGRERGGCGAAHHGSAGVQGAAAAAAAAVVRSPAHVSSVRQQWAIVAGGG